MAAFSRRHKWMMNRAFRHSGGLFLAVLFVGWGLRGRGLADDTSTPAPGNEDLQKKAAWRQLVDRQAAEYKIVVAADAQHPLGPPKAMLRWANPTRITHSHGSMDSCGAARALSRPATVGSSSGACPRQPTGPTPGRPRSTSTSSPGPDFLTFTRVSEERRFYKRFETRGGLGTDLSISVARTANDRSTARLAIGAAPPRKGSAHRRQAVRYVDLAPVSALRSARFSAPAEFSALAS